MKLDLENANVFHLDLTVEQIRNSDEEAHEELEGKLDEAQGFVFSDEGSEAYLVIRVTK